MRHCRVPLLIAALFCVPSPSEAQSLIPAQKTISTAGSSCNPNTNCVELPSIALQGVGRFTVDVKIGTSITLVPEYTVAEDTWRTASDVNGNSSISSDGAYVFENDGWRGFRLRASAISGNATVDIWRGYSAGVPSAVSANIADIEASLATLLTHTDGLEAPLVELGDSITSNILSVDVKKIDGNTPTADLTFDMDTGAGTQTRSAIGLAVPASGGAVQVSGTANGLYTQGAVAHGTADAGNPVNLGATVETSLSGITVASDGQRTKLYAGADGVLIVRPHANLEDITRDRATNTDGASTAFAGELAAAGAGIKHWLTWCTVANSSATAVTVDLRDGVAGSVLWTVPAPANTNGAHVMFPTPIDFSANTAVAYDASAAATTITITCGGFKSKL